MKQAIRLSYNGQEIQFIGAAHLGRITEMSWHRECPQPEVFNQLEAIVCFSGEGAGSISRNHAAIYPDTNDQFSIVDLGSSHGTKVNGRPIDSHPEQLYPGDKILLGERVELRVENIEGLERRNYAILVGHPGFFGKLPGVRHDLEELAEQLEKRGFAGNVHQLYDARAGKASIMKALRTAQERTDKYSHVIFHYSGHGDTSGLAVGIFATISPEELYPALAKIPGKKAVILDCCHAGIFLSEDRRRKIPENTLVLAASSAKGKAYELPDYRIAGGHYMGRFTAALVRYLDRHKERLNLRDFEGELRREFPQRVFDLYCQEPRVTGVAFTMPTERVSQRKRL